MRKLLQSEIVTTGLAIFSMLFGAGNLIFPLQVGLVSGDKLFWGMVGFLLTGILIPLAGLVALILFDGDYETFFKRLGDLPGSIIIFLCMLTIGPLYAMPRIVNISYAAIAPFISPITLIPFSITFLLLTFWGSYKETGIIRFLGSIVSPILLISLGIIIIKGVFFASTGAQPIETSSLKLFWDNVKEGYNTLDLLGTIFFSSIVVSILKKNQPDYDEEQSLHKLAIIGFKAGSLGVFLLAIVYIFMGLLAAYHGYGLEQLNQADLFSAISQRVLGSRGTVIISSAVLMACYSTVIALAAVVSEYLTKITKGRVSYISALIGVLVTAAIVSTAGLDKIFAYSIPLTQIAYPVIIVITFCNIFYKLWGFKPIIVPTIITLGISLIAKFY